MPFRCFIVLVVLALFACGENPVAQKVDRQALLERLA
jgi:hypothetical protein